MRYEIKERIETIIANDENLGGLIRIEKQFPALIQAPALLVIPRQDGGYQPSGSSRFVVDVQFDIRVYLADIGTRLQAINNIESVVVPDLFATAFLSRLQLQYGDTGLSGVSGDLNFRIVSDLARPIEYPIGVPSAPRFWGFIARLTIPYRQFIKSKVGGL